MSHNTDADARAAQAVVTHHRQLAAALTGHVTDLVTAAEMGGLRQVWHHRDALLGWLHTELLPHAYAEENALYPAAAARPEGRLLVDGMLDEHRTIAALVAELEETSAPVAAAAAARALQAVFSTHLAKENDLVVPLLVAAGDVSLADLLDGMHDLIGGGGQEGCGGHCGCGGDAPSEGEPAVLSIDPRLDVRDLPHGQRHARVLAAIDALPADGALVLVAPHAPMPLLAEIDARYHGQMAAEWLQNGPDVWQIRLQRVTVAV
ncbi:hypothetical protein Aca07nite_57140 [Actinoplanes capillaceus]|uniref:Hemerythrin HHE cation binding domain-containing protein n=1 Tax=Actinoplanes campanulatus TaxID=113559 RepID=A0ABQ3WQA0_9ACTN|nr:DUF2249 domain-containing protein [Actinoplanes capillaceus]GID48439.1 hypothetical protein Aca07nite_57140 [Actinoplanes capillaceus]